MHEKILEARDAYLDKKDALEEILSDNNISLEPLKQLNEAAILYVRSIKA